MCRAIFNTFHALPVGRKMTFVILNLNGPAKQKIFHLGKHYNFHISPEVDPEGVRSNPPFRENYFFFMENV